MVACYLAELRLPTDESHRIRSMERRYLLVCLAGGWQSENLKYLNVIKLAISS